MTSVQYISLLNFCKKYSSIVCYGASEHGFIVKHFLELHNVTVSAFLVSDKNDNDVLRDGIPVYSVTDLDKLQSDEGIVLSLYERHHKAILRTLKLLGYTDNVFAISDALQQQMHLDLVIADRKSTLCTKPLLNEEELKKNEVDSKVFFNHYKRVECRFFDVLAIGAYSLWIYYSYLRAQASEDVFHLYYPVVYEHRLEEKLKGANEYLLQKMNCLGMAVVSKQNLSFWQYVFQTYEERCILYDDYTFTGYSENLKKNYKNVQLDKSLIKLSEQEIDIGNKRGKEMGIKAAYICISNRDIVYRKMRNREILKADFRDAYRNSNIENHRLAVEYLAANNIQAVRMGAVVEKQWEHENVVNYAGSEYRSEFMDVYLVSQCKFFVGDLSGILAFAMLLAKPMIITNAPLLTTRYDAVAFISPDKDIALLKKLWDSKNNRYLTIQDMLNYEVNICVQEPNIAGAVFREYKDRGIVPVDNTPEEILAVVKEMNERIDGTVQYDELDIELQARYREIVDNYPMKENVLNNWRLGAVFLRENQWLLE